MIRVVIDDAEDDYVQATGRLARADYLVTGDKGLLALRQYVGTKIITPKEIHRVGQERTAPTRPVAPKTAGLLSVHSARARSFLRALLPHGPQVGVPCLGRVLGPGARVLDVV